MVGNKCKEKKNKIDWTTTPAHTNDTAGGGGKNSGQRVKRTGIRFKLEIH